LSQQESPTKIYHIADLTVEYYMRRLSIRAVNSVNLRIEKGEAFGIVGESGSGKTTLALSLLNLVPKPGRITSGSIIYDGNKDVLKLNGNELRRFRWEEVAMVFQGALNSFNPVVRIGDQMLETIDEHKSLDRQEGLKKISTLLEMVRLDPERTMRSFPHELSGGMKQRTMIAMSLLLDPKVLILDEPTTALDVISQKHILNILADLRKQIGATIILLSHDLAIFTEVVERIAVMYAGKLVEVASMDDLFLRPKHPYTLGLMQATPSVLGDVSKLKPIPGSPPDMFSLPKGCPFNPRCPFTIDTCRKVNPPLEEIPGNRLVACHRWRDVT